jgi:hypothetical protein
MSRIGSEFDGDLLNLLIDLMQFVQEFARTIHQRPKARRRRMRFWWAGLGGGVGHGRTS